ncbi:MAG: 4-alpha-glucanotransferase, partial [Blastocatellia bacterium]
SGILLHPTSLPGPFGIGDLGPEADRFVDLLEEAGQGLWQVLPLGPTGYGDSPYQCFSAFAGNPLLISPERLAQEGLLAPADWATLPSFPEAEVDYGRVIPAKMSLLERAVDRLLDAVGAGETGPLAPLVREYQDFKAETGWWLEDYALFRAIKEQQGGVAWTAWDPYLRDRQAMALHFFRENHPRLIERHRGLQFLFFRQWLALAHYAREKRVRIVGDVPIFVAHDSADVWAHRDLYHLDEEGHPAWMAGVPPDYFSEDGQLWGNPIYRWDRMKEDGYRWWLARLRAALSLFDLVRLDHFRGFEKYWAVPAGEKTARRGTWELGPGADLFRAIEAHFQFVEGGDLPIIAEDLGLITPEVRQLREAFRLPGMQVLQFAFGTDPEADRFKPYSFEPNTVVYTGTHDNDTTRGWFQSMSEAGTGTPVSEERRLLLSYVGTDGREIHWDLIRVALASVAHRAILPFQDLLGLGSEARMNRPSREAGNWSWRFVPRQVTPAMIQRLAEMTETYGRNRERQAQKRQVQEAAAAVAEEREEALDGTS